MLFKVSVLAATMLAASAAAAPPLEAYGRLAAIEDIELSPDGRRVAFITVNGENRELVIQEFGGKQRIRLNAGQAKVRDVSWAGPDHVLITSTATGRVGDFIGRQEWAQIGAYGVKTAKYAVLLSNTPNTMNTPFGDPVVAEHRGETVVLVPGLTRKGGLHQSLDLYRVDLNTGRGSIHMEGDEDVRDWVAGPDGAVLAKAETNDLRGSLSIFTRSGAGWRQLLTGTEEAPVGLMGLGRTPGTLLVTKRDGDRTRLYEMIADTGALTAPLDIEGKTASGVLWDPKTQRPMAIAYLDDSSEYRFFDPARDRAWRSLKASFKNQNVVYESATPDFKKVVVRVEGAEDAASFYLYDVDAKKVEFFADARPGVPPEAIGPVRWIRYKAADGLEIPAYLTLPPGRAGARNLPLIVLPHGGPQARDEPGFDWWSQALASRGYAVLQPQFRGSEGFGRKFVEAGYGQWGRKMQTDLSDGVRHLAKEGVIDPKRVCIMGASYGGYAAMAGVTLDPGVYRCSVAVAGVGDLADMIAWEAKNAGRANSGAVRYWSRFMGTSFRKRGELDAVSPTEQAAKADAPILVIHGKDDTVVPYQQSADFVRAMQKAGKPVEFITLNGEDHWLSRGATRLQMLQQAVAFVEKHNPPS